MQKKIITKTIQLLDGRVISIETGRLAPQADGAVVVRMGKTMLLATVVVNKNSTEKFDFLPLYVDYQEKYAAVGRIPGGFLKREGRLNDHEILISRLVDRAIRPLFSADFRLETQINIYLISSEDTVVPDTLAALAASAALMTTNIPFQGPVSEVRVAKINNTLCINPQPAHIEKSTINLIVGATESDVLMVEGDMHEVTEEEMLQAIQFAHEAIKMHCQVQKTLKEAIGLQAISTQATVISNKSATAVAAAQEQVTSELYDEIYKVIKKGIANKQTRTNAFQIIQDTFLASCTKQSMLDTDLNNKIYQDTFKKAARDFLLQENIRLDGRKFDEIRPISAEIDYLPIAHGSAIFTRGETQSLTTVTLGTKLDEQTIDYATKHGYNKFILHYNFPGFSTGEVKSNRGPGRREIGHGNLAMRALKQVLPSEEENPYTIRIVSDILASNGSSSMATVCAGSLALMDAGIAIKSAVAGIAMGLITDTINKKHTILSDILGDEDYLGDMDFKIAGTEKGITACQMDMKIPGITYELLQEALEQARKGRLHILNNMNSTIACAKEYYKANVPRTKTLTIERDMIGAVIGPSGKVIQEIQRETGSIINIEELDGKGIVKIFSPNKEMIDIAVAKIKGITAVPCIDEIYTGYIKAILHFGAFVEFLPGKEGLLHISEVNWERIDDIEKILTVGEEIKVKLIDIDKKTGKYRLSRKVLLPNPQN